MTRWAEQAVRDCTYKVVPFLAVCLLIAFTAVVLVYSVSIREPIPRDVSVAIAIIFGVLMALFLAGYFHVYLRGAMARAGGFRPDDGEEEGHTARPGGTGTFRGPLDPPQSAHLHPNGGSNGQRQPLQGVYQGYGPQMAQGMYPPAPAAVHSHNSHGHELPAHTLARGAGADAFPVQPVDGVTSHTIIHPDGSSVTRLEASPHARAGSSGISDAAEPEPEPEPAPASKPQRKPNPERSAPAQPPTPAPTVPRSHRSPSSAHLPWPPAVTNPLPRLPGFVSCGTNVNGGGLAGSAAVGQDEPTRPGPEAVFGPLPVVPDRPREPAARTRTQINSCQGWERRAPVTDFRPKTQKVQGI